MHASQTGPGRHGGFVALTLIVIATVIAGCGAISSDEEDRGYWSPFHSQSNWSMDEGSMRVELTGFERGHEPGQESEFELVIENRRDQPMSLSGCVQLIDEASVVQRFGDFEVELGPDAVGRRALETPFEEELEPRAYGLAVVIGDLGSVVHTVRLGLADDEAGPWLDAGELTCE